jgi:Calcineurin-like phosphoesterase superfamily domain
VTLGGQRIALFHATPHDPRFRYLLATAPASEWERELEGVDTDLVLLGHTHRPVVFSVGRVTVANAGSLGLPTDGDPRASYAVIEDGEVRLERFAYAAGRPLFVRTRDGVLPVACAPDWNTASMIPGRWDRKAWTGSRHRGRCPGADRRRGRPARGAPGAVPVLIPVAARRASAGRGTQRDGRRRGHLSARAERHLGRWSP